MEKNIYLRIINIEGTLKKENNPISVEGDLFVSSIEDAKKISAIYNKSMKHREQL